MANDNERARRSFFGMFAAQVDSGTLKELKPAELRLFGALMRHADFDTGRCHPSRETLRALTGLSFHAIAAGLRGLIERGKIEKKRGSKRLGFRNQYRVLCFCEEKVHQSRGPAFVHRTYTKANAEKDADPPILSGHVEIPAQADPAFVHNTFRCFGEGKVHDKPLEPLKRREEKREEVAPPPAPLPSLSSHIGEIEEQKIAAGPAVAEIIAGATASISKPRAEKRKLKPMATGESAFKESIQKIISPEGEKVL